MVDVTRQFARRDGHGRQPRFHAHRALAVFGLVGLTVVALACGGGDELESTTLLTIEECREVGGSPLFDPDDGRPIQESCPEGLRFIGEFTEPFFGTDGGLCCANEDDADAPPATAEPARPGER